MFTLKSPHRGNSYEYTQYAIFNMKRKIILNYPKSTAMGFFQVIQERVRNSRGKRAVGIRVIEVSVYFLPAFMSALHRANIFLLIHICPKVYLFVVHILKHFFLFYYILMFLINIFPK